MKRSREEGGGRLLRDDDGAGNILLAQQILFMWNENSENAYHSNFLPVFVFFSTGVEAGSICFTVWILQITYYKTSARHRNGQLIVLVF
jgi:hypothetical protein